MDATTRRELVGLANTDDLYAMLTFILCQWAKKYHPDCDGASVYVWRRDGLPPERITIPVSACAVR